MTPLTILKSIYLESSLLILAENVAVSSATVTVNPSATVPPSATLISSLNFIVNDVPFAGTVG